MADDAPAHPRRGRGPTLILLAVGAALLISSFALCARGAGLIADENYDGIVSWLNPAALASCLAAVVLAVIALVIGVLAAFREGRSAPPR